MATTSPARISGATNSTIASAVGETRVLPEDLRVTWEKLSRAFGEAAPAGSRPPAEV